MFSLVSKVFVALAALAMGAAVGYGVVVGDRSGITLFVGLSLTALLAALAMAGTGVHDPATDDDDTATTTVLPSEAATPSPWPLLAAAVAVVLAVGLVTGAAVVIPAVVLAAAVFAGWLGQTWREHASWTPRVRERVTFRLLLPAALPVLTLALVAVLAVSISRVLLAVNKDAAAGIALVVALAVLFGCFYLSARPRITSSALMGLAAVAAAAVVAAGVVGAAEGERSFHPEHEGAVGVRLVAANTSFDKKRIELAAGEEVEVTLVNRDALPHNFAIYSGDQPVTTGPPFSGPDRRVYRLEAPKAGTYQFVCEIHPQIMRGEVVVK